MEGIIRAVNGIEKLGCEVSGIAIDRDQEGGELILTKVISIVP